MIAKKLKETYWFLRQLTQNRNNDIKNGAYVLSFDVELEKDVACLPKVLDILRKFEIKASFAIIGRLVEKFQDEHRMIIIQGHEVVNHTYSHPYHEQLNKDQHFNKISFEMKKQEIIKCDQVCREILGYKPVGFRTPHFAHQHTEDIYKILVESNYLYSSSTLANSLFLVGPRRVHNKLVEIPLGCSIKHPFKVFDSWDGLVSKAAIFSSTNEFLEEFNRIINLTKQTKTFTSHYFDPSHISNNGILEKMCEVLKKSNVNTLTYKEALEKVF